MNRVLLVDDHHLFADAVRSVLVGRGVEVFVAPCSNEAVEMAERSDPDVTVVDLSFPETRGAAIGLRILDAAPRTRLVGVTGGMRSPGFNASKMFDLLVSKDAPLEFFLIAIEATTHAHPAPRSPSRTGAVRQPRTAMPGEPLSPREHEILAHLARGASGEEIARELGVSQHTVRSHVQRLLMKLQVHSRLEAVAAAERLGILTSPADVPAS